MSNKPYSNSDAYRDLLIKAMQTSPSLFYILCRMLMETRICPHKNVQYSEQPREEDVPLIFGTDDTMKKYLQHVFGKFLVKIGLDLTQGGGKKMDETVHWGRPVVVADTAFVQWVQQSGVISIDHVTKSVTIL